MLNGTKGERPREKGINVGQTGTRGNVVNLGGGGVGLRKTNQRGGRTIEGVQEKGSK